MLGVSLSAWITGPSIVTTACWIWRLMPLEEFLTSDELGAGSILWIIESALFLGVLGDFRGLLANLCFMSLGAAKILTILLHRIWHMWKSCLMLHRTLAGVLWIFVGQFSQVARLIALGGCRRQLLLSARSGLVVGVWVQICLTLCQGGLQRGTLGN